MKLKDWYDKYNQKLIELDKQKRSNVDGLDLALDIFSKNLWAFKESTEDCPEGKLNELFKLSLYKWCTETFVRISKRIPEEMKEMDKEYDEFDPITYLMLGSQQLYEIFYFYKYIYCQLFHGSDSHEACCE